MKTTLINIMLLLVIAQIAIFIIGVVMSIKHNPTSFIYLIVSISFVIPVKILNQIVKNIKK